MKTLLLLPVILLAGCSWLPTKTEVKYIDRDIYVVRHAPAELYSVPSPTDPINVDAATQRTVAEWVLRNDRRSEELEKKIKALKEFYERPVVEAEKQPTK